MAHVFDGVENDRTASWQNGERCVYLSIQKQPGINVVQIVDAIKALLPAIREQLPASVTLDVRSDRSVTIRESVHDVKLTLLVTICLVVLVDLHLPAEHLGHAHPQPRAARLDRSARSR